MQAVPSKTSETECVSGWTLHVSTCEIRFYDPRGRFHGSVFPMNHHVDLPMAQDWTRNLSANLDLVLSHDACAAVEAAFLSGDILAAIRVLLIHGEER